MFSSSIKYCILLRRAPLSTIWPGFQPEYDTGILTGLQQPAEDLRRSLAIMPTIETTLSYSVHSTVLKKYIYLSLQPGQSRERNLFVCTTANGFIQPPRFPFLFCYPDDPPSFSACNLECLDTNTAYGTCEFVDTPETCDRAQTLPVVSAGHDSCIRGYRTITMTFR